ncbi:MAG: 16S rRNA (guanine(527)-N(7))-methyltransferase RsmG [bacterium]
MEQYSAMGELYRSWNEKINVISRKDIDQIYTHHILHSLSIAKFVRFRPNTRILDAGTGGGFPGMPLALFFPDVQFSLVDSIAKKIRVVSEIANSLKLNNVEPICARVESLNRSFDFVTGRAVSDPGKFFALVKNKLRAPGFNEVSNGILYLSGGDLSIPLQKVDTAFSIVELSHFFTQPYFSTKKLIHIRKS